MQTPNRIHALLDGEGDTTTRTPEEGEVLARYRQALARLEPARVRAPDGFAASVLAALPPPRRPSLIRIWLERWLPTRQPSWAVPALAGALAMLLAMLGAWHIAVRAHTQQVWVHFEIHAPGANHVELVGDFNNWRAGAIHLRGPDASGHWTTAVELPEGRHEYLFLVDGKTWMTDPHAATHRPDGFGRQNAVLDVYADERS